MQNTIETSMYQIGQLFLLPTLLLISLLFLYAFFVLGEFITLALRRRSGGGQLLLLHFQKNPQTNDDELDMLAHRLIEGPRITSRVTPMLGLVATMIPMGPALKALADGQLADVSRSLMMAFSAVILALIAAALSYVVVNVRRRWYAVELVQIEMGRLPLAAQDIAPPQLQEARA